MRAATCLELMGKAGKRIEKARENTEIDGQIVSEQEYD